MLRIEISSQEAKRIFAGLLLLDLFLVLIYLTDNLLGNPIWTLHKWIDLDGEHNIPAWISSTQLFLVGAVFLYLAGRGKSSVKPSPSFLGLLGAAFLALSADEIVEIHEGLTKALKHVAWLPRYTEGHGTWIPIYLTVILGFLVISWRQFLALYQRFPREFWIMALGAGMFLLGAVGVEILGYQIEKDSARWLNTGEVILEELLELIGESVMLYGVILFATQKSLADNT
jgi:hypothetical protein